MSSIEEVVGVLEGFEEEKKIRILQALLQKPETAGEPALLSKIEELARTGDVAVRFWARKLYAKISQLPPTANNEATVQEVTVENQGDLPIDLLFQKLQSVKSGRVLD